MNMTSDIIFYNVLACIEQMQREADSFVDGRMHRELCDHIQTLCGFLSVSRFVEDSRNKAAVTTLESLYGCLNLVRTAYESRQRVRPENDYVPFPPPVITGHQGRPQYSISAEQISHLVSLWMNWQSIAMCLGVSSRTLNRHRQQVFSRWCIQHYQMTAWTELLVKFFSLQQTQANDMCMGAWGHVGYAFKGGVSDRVYKKLILLDGRSEEGVQSVKEFTVLQLQINYGE